MLVGPALKATIPWRASGVGRRTCPVVAQWPQPWPPNNHQDWATKVIWTRKRLKNLQKFKVKKNSWNVLGVQIRVALLLAHSSPTMCKQLGLVYSDQINGPHIQLASVHTSIVLCMIPFHHNRRSSWGSREKKLGCTADNRLELIN